MIVGIVQHEQDSSSNHRFNADISPCRRKLQNSLGLQWVQESDKEQLSPFRREQSPETWVL